MYKEIRMELNTKYQYTYFIKSFLINPNKYNKYLLGLLRDKNWSLKLFEKEKDFNLYTYFIQDTRDYFFPSFNYDREKIRNLKEMNKELKAAALADLPCNIFEYKLNKEIQGKVADESAIFFEMRKIELICFDTGVCFLVIKTILEDNENFSEILDFNAKFKDVNSDFYKLKRYNNIRIQTDKFSNMKELSTFIDELVCVNNKNIIDESIDLYNKRFFTYSYVCIDQKDWNEVDRFENIQDEFYKLNNAISNHYTPNFNKDEAENDFNIISRWEYVKFGFTKQSGCLMCSNIDIRNYTEFPFEYENEYLYTLIIRLYQRIYINKISIECNKKSKISWVMKAFSKFSKEIWRPEITNSETGSLFYEKWNQVFELEELYNQTKLKYDVIYKDMQIEKTIAFNKFMKVAFAISLLLNVGGLMYWIMGIL